MIAGGRFLSILFSMFREAWNIFALIFVALFLLSIPSALALNLELASWESISFAFRLALSLNNLPNQLLPESWILLELIIEIIGYAFFGLVTALTFLAVQRTMDQEKSLNERTD